MIEREFLENKELGYCDYCKEPILSDESYVKLKDGRLYHEFCWRQMNTYFDEFDFGEEGEE